MAAVLGDANATLKDLTAIWEYQLRETRPSLVPLLATERQSDGAYEKYPIPTNVGMPSKFEGERKSLGVDVNAVYNLDNQTYTLTVDLGSDLVRDVKAYSLADVVAEAAQSMVLFPDYVISQLVSNGESLKGYDGNAFYGNTHLFANAGGNNIDNLLDSAGTNTASLLTDIAAAIAAIRGYKDNAGRLLNQVAAEGPENLVAHVPVALEIAMRTALQASIITQTSNVLQGIARVAPDGYLSGNSWYLHYVGAPTRPFVFQKRSEVESNVFGLGSEFEVNHRKVRIAGTYRFALGYLRFDRSVKLKG